jgi:hypothetical protein
MHAGEGCVRRGSWSIKSINALWLIEQCLEENQSSTGWSNTRAHDTGSQAGKDGAKSAKTFDTAEQLLPPRTKQK